jgi:hypothetical protein
MNEEGLFGEAFRSYAYFQDFGSEEAVSHCQRYRSPSSALVRKVARHSRRDTLRRSTGVVTEISHVTSQERLGSGVIRETDRKVREEESDFGNRCSGLCALVPFEITD